tara:strand:- start:456 stop:644 length:189 start_codon:yes stop_codon:yes gene_type:complete
MSNSGVTVSMSMSPKKAGAMYLENKKLKKQNKELKDKISRALDYLYEESDDSSYNACEALNS